jgi:hypothetical protein
MAGSQLTFGSAKTLSAVTFHSLYQLSLSPDLIWKQSRAKKNASKRLAVWNHMDGV